MIKQEQEKEQEQSIHGKQLRKDQRYFFGTYAGTLFRANFIDIMGTHCITLRMYDSVDKLNTLHRRLDGRIQRKQKQVVMQTMPFAWIDTVLSLQDIVGEHFHNLPPEIMDIIDSYL